MVPSSTNAKFAEADPFGLTDTVTSVSVLSVNPSTRVAFTRIAPRAHFGELIAAVLIGGLDRYLTTVPVQKSNGHPADTRFGIVLDSIAVLIVEDPAGDGLLFAKARNFEIPPFRSKQAGNDKSLW